MKARENVSYRVSANVDLYVRERPRYPVNRIVHWSTLLEADNANIFNTIQDIRRDIANAIAEKMPL